MSRILGLHHVTAIASDPQRNLGFYTGVLGLRLVKRTVNFDDPRTYHFYFGDEIGTPGSVMTFFPWPGARRGRHGAGQVTVTSFSVPPSAIGFWLERLISYNVRYAGPTRRGPGGDVEHVIAFSDPDGLLLEIVGHAGAESRSAWDGGRGVPRDHAIRGLRGITLWVEAVEPTERVLVDTLGFRPVRDDEATRRYTVGDGASGTVVDVRTIGGFGRGAEGAGTVHHVAFAVADDASQLAVRERLSQAGLQPTPVIDRTYFHSVYFREPAGILYELATNPPGFAVDEPLDRLGERLALPPQYEPHRDEIEAGLPLVHLPERPDAGSLFAELTRPEDVA